MDRSENTLIPSSIIRYTGHLTLRYTVERTSTQKCIGKKRRKSTDLTEIGVPA